MRIKNKIQVIGNKKKKKYYWRVLHQNGNILLHSEMYSSFCKARQSALNFCSIIKRSHAKYEEIIK
jgi:uncharacterized protein YegP (UPF0339 family)